MEQWQIIVFKWFSLLQITSGSMESMDIDPKAFDKTIHVVQSNNKSNITEELVKYKISLESKAKMNIPLCHMVLVPIIRSTFKIDMLKME